MILKTQILRRVAVAGFLLVTLACVACSTTPYNYQALNTSKPRSILVIPPVNDTVEVDASYTYLSTVTRPLAEKGYYVFPVAVIDQFLKENGLPTPAEMNSIPLDKIREHIGADAVLYINLHQWGQKYQVLSSKAVVSFSMRLVDTKTGQLLWNAKGSAQQSSGDNGGGLAGALVGAIVDQVAGSLMDHTQQLSSMANHQAIHNASSGLLPGPYKAAVEKKN